MACRPSSGDQPRSAWIRSDEATSVAGSPARRGAAAAGMSRPVTSRQAASTCRLENGPAAQVVDGVLAWHAGGQRQQVRPGQVADVDVVPDAGAVRRRIVGTEDADRPPAGQGHRQHVRDQVGLVRVPLAQPAAGRVPVRAGHVEVTQADRAQPVHPGMLGERGVDGELGRAVRAGRQRRRGFGDRHLLGIAVDGRGGRKHDARRARCPDRLEQREGAAEIVRPVPGLAPRPTRQPGTSRRNAGRRRRRPRVSGRPSPRRSPRTNSAPAGTASACPVDRSSSTTTS